jgi:hypothetical protein
MRVTTDDFFRLTGGFRIGETHEQLRERISEIVNLEASLAASDPKSERAARIRDRLRELKEVETAFA